MEILKNELFLLYKAYLQGTPSPLAEPSIQYADYAIWEREHFSGDHLEVKLAYWRRIADNSLNTTLPADRVPTTVSYDGDVVSVAIPSELAEQLRQLARNCKVTLFTVLFAAFISLIHAFSGYRYNFFCIPVANRTRKETQSLVGCFMNFQFIYIDLSDNPTFLELVERLNRTLHDVYGNYVPFHFVSQQIPPQAGIVDFQLLTASDDESANLEKFSLFPIKLKPQEFALFPVDVRLLDSSETITGHFKYQTAVYDRKTILNMVNDYTALLTRTAHNPDLRLSDMGITPHPD
jgi:non-ribosomal peptide synthetase component F